MSNTILKELKIATAVDPKDDSFNDELQTWAYSVIGDLFQAGVPFSKFELSSEDTWESLIPGVKPEVLPAIKAYFIFSVRLKFDPPALKHSFSDLQQSKDESFWRIIQGLEYDIN